MAAIIVYGAVAAWSAYSSYRQGQAAKQQGEQLQGASESQAQLADYNAAVAELQSADAIARGADEESRFRTQLRATVGSLRAGGAAHNIDVNYGSPVDTQADAAYLGELDALQIRSNAVREAWGFHVSAEDLRRRAVITRREGANAAAAGRTQANAIYVQGAANILGQTNSLLQSRYAMSHATTNPAGPTTGGY